MTLISSPSRKLQIVSILLAGVLLFLALRGVNWWEMVETVRQGQVKYLALVCVMLTTTLFIRGLRWRILLRAEKRIAPLTVFWATCVGYLGNNFLPARAGELIRSALIGRVANTSKSTVLATAVTERILDVVALVLFGLLAVLMIDEMPEWLLSSIGLMGVAAVVGMIGLVMVSRLDGVLDGVVERLPLPPKLRPRVKETGDRFLLGLRAFQHHDRALGFALLTMVVWVVDGLGAVVVARALNLPPLGLLQALLLLTALGLSSAVPSTPGYVGIYQFVGVTLLPLFNFSQSQALAFVIVLQGLTYLVVTLWGLLGLWRLNVTGSDTSMIGGELRN